MALKLPRDLKVMQASEIIVCERKDAFCDDADVDDSSPSFRAGREAVVQVPENKPNAVVRRSIYKCVLVARTRRALTRAQRP